MQKQLKTMEKQKQQIKTNVFGFLLFSFVFLSFFDDVQANGMHSPSEQVILSKSFKTIVQIIKNVTFYDFGTKNQLKTTFWE